MKDFFYIVFGGLAAMMIGMLCVAGIKAYSHDASSMHSTYRTAQADVATIDAAADSSSGNYVANQLNAVLSGYIDEATTTPTPVVPAPASSQAVIPPSRPAPIATSVPSTAPLKLATTTRSTPFVRYTAVQEEDLINNALRSLPVTASKSVKASTYIVKDLDTGEVFLKQDENRVVPIASLTKLVTAEVARRLIDPNDNITITPAIMSTYGNTANFKAGETYTAGDLLYPLLMVSSNDAAEAYAQHYGRAAFIRAMNDFAQSIGAYRTYFDDPSGLSPQNVSSAVDMSLILDWIRQNDPTIISVTLLKTKTLRTHTWINPTHFLNWSYFAGGKNGYTDEADRTAATLFRLGAKKDLYSVIVLGSPNRDVDMIDLISKIK